MLVCLQHDRCRHNIPRCRCENCWVDFTPCRHVVEMCRHHVPNIYLCEACLEDHELSTIDPALRSPGVVDVPSTSTTNPDTPPDNQDDIDDIVADVSEASTILRDDDDLFVNFAAIFHDDYHTFWIRTRRLGRRWKKALTRLLGFLPSLRVFTHAGYVHFLFDLRFYTHTPLFAVQRILTILDADHLALRFAKLTLIQVTRFDIYLSYCKTVYQPVHIPHGVQTNNIHLRL
jgi:hypothetical protein